LSLNAGLPGFLSHWVGSFNQAEESVREAVGIA
jgi:hypothetical protein